MEYDSHYVVRIYLKNIYKMSALSMVIGLFAITAIVMLAAMSAVNSQLPINWFTQPTVNNGNLLDPNGPSVQFILFTRTSFPVNLKIGNESLFVNSGFNISLPTKIIIHGFLSSINEDIFITLKSAYLETGNCNVIGMDWSALCEFEYISAMWGVRHAGHYLGKFLNWLEQMGVPLDSIHIIGHSMGAHVAGVGGSTVEGGKVARITGLDPAKPGYTETKLENKLDSEDATLVDVVHTFMRVLSLVQPMGHIDFYPNGGKFQTGCPDLQDVWNIPESLFCNHARAYHLFAESIRNKNAFKCTKCNSVEDAFQGKCEEESTVHMGQAETYVFSLKRSSDISDGGQWSMLEATLEPGLDVSEMLAGGFTNITFLNKVGWLDSFSQESKVKNNFW